MLFSQSFWDCDIVNQVKGTKTNQVFIVPNVYTLASTNRYKSYNVTCGDANQVKIRPLLSRSRQHF